MYLMDTMLTSEVWELLEFKMCLCGLRNVDYALHYDFMPSKAYLILTLCVLFT